MTTKDKGKCTYLTNDERWEEIDGRFYYILGSHSYSQERSIERTRQWVTWFMVDLVAIDKLLIDIVNTNTSKETKAELLAPVRKKRCVVPKKVPKGQEVWRKR